MLIFIYFPSIFYKIFFILLLTIIIIYNNLSKQKNIIFSYFKKCEIFIDLNFFIFLILFFHTYSMIFSLIFKFLKEKSISFLKKYCNL